MLSSCWCKPITVRIIQDLRKDHQQWKNKATFQHLHMILALVIILLVPYIFKQACFYWIDQQFQCKLFQRKACFSSINKNFSREAYSIPFLSTSRVEISQILSSYTSMFKAGLLTFKYFDRKSTILYYVRCTMSLSFLNPKES